ncbi:hypothetical protein GGR21_003352 [Dysgonomonas hofstadii]|uniref:Uncharacterized protein n=1 Tax=Dysgonomonas hofstadii TaxID=637886 RepID=A0A840CXE1_9BACT|nr:hypothetical protein [Dysgonomonas hofstadii]
MEKESTFSTPQQVLKNIEFELQTLAEYMKMSQG